MNSPDALAATAMEGAGIVRRPSWRAEVDLAAGHLVRLFAEHEPAPVPLHLMFQPCGWPRRRSGLRRLPRRALARRRSVQRAARESINRIIVQFLNRAKCPWYTKPLINRVS